MMFIAFSARIELCKRSHPLPLTPVKDVSILRANTRLWRSDDLTIETKFPIILPKKYSVTDLIVKDNINHEMDWQRYGCKLHS